MELVILGIISLFQQCLQRYTLATSGSGFPAHAFEIPMNGFIWRFRRIEVHGFRQLSGNGSSHLRILRVRGSNIRMKQYIEVEFYTEPCLKRVILSGLAQTNPA